MASNYITGETVERTRVKRPVKRFVAPFVSILLAFAVIFMGTGLGNVSIEKAEAADDPIEAFFCTFLLSEEDEEERTPLYLLYQFAFTDDLYYYTQSKSAVAGGAEDVAAGLNMLSFTKDFKATNDVILGRSLDPSEEKDGPYNGGERVNPYDRFGVAGLTWSSYSGEWNYYKTEVCEGRSINMRLGALYEDRLVPISTFANAEKSTDVRSRIASVKVASFAFDWYNVLANSIFNVTKFLVIATNSLIGLSFTDITSLIGLDKILADKDGLFGQLYTYIYLPMILLAMLLMATWAAYMGIVKRAYRATLGGIAKSIFMFFAAIVIALNPAFWMALPNNFAIIMQSVLVNALGSGIYSGDSLCAVGGVYTVDKDGKPVPVQEGQTVDVNPDAPTDATDVDEAGDLLQRASQSMQSLIGCQIWYSYAFRPWTIGQFGVEYHQLWANGYADTSLNADAKELGNDNAAMVGDASVPMGGGYFMNNWALFHISTQTNAHSPISDEENERKKPSIYTDGVARDWWRIVDAVTNYNETIVKTGIPGSNECEVGSVDGAGCASDGGSTSSYIGVEQNETPMPDLSKKPTPYMERWIGFDPLSRIGIAFVSIVPAFFGNLAPIVFAGIAAVMGLAITVAVAFAPIFLLIGVVPGNGFRIFKEWLQLLLNLVVRRIVAGFMLVLSLVIISMILAYGDSMNWFVGNILLAALAFVLIKMRSTIFEHLAGLFTFNFAGGAFQDTSMNALKKTWDYVNPAEHAKTGISAVTAGMQYAEAGRKGKGGGFGGGFWEGARADLKMRMYSGNALMRQTAMYMDKFSDNEDAVVSPSELCAYCGNPLVQEGRDDFEVRASRDKYGNFVCEDCSSGQGIKGREPLENGAGSVETFKVQTAEYLKERKGVSMRNDLSDDEIAEVIQTRKSRGVIRDIPLAAHSAIEHQIDEAVFVDKKTGLKHKNLHSALGRMFREEIREFEKSEKIPPIPSELAEYVTQTNQDRVEVLWRDGSIEAKEAIAYVYAQAFVNYAYDAGLRVGDIAATGDKPTIQQDINVVYGDLLAGMTRDKKNPPKSKGSK